MSGVSAMPLSAADLAHLEAEGWVLGKGIIPSRYIAALQQEIEGVVDTQARQMMAQGKIEALHEEAGFLSRAALIYQQHPEIMSVLKGGTHAGKAMFELLTCPVRRRPSPSPPPHPTPAVPLGRHFACAGAA